MIAGPIFSREVLTLPRQFRHYLIRSGYIGLGYVLFLGPGFRTARACLEEIMIPRLLGRVADIELNELLADTAQQFETLLAEKQLAFRLSLPPRALVCRGDDTRLAQLLANLLNNSIKYTDSGGEVVLSLARQGDRALVTLADSAPGVPDEALPQLFDHLYRVDSSRNRKTGGSGLGLAICARVAEAHQGSLSAAHSPQGGLQITLALPCQA